MKGLHDNEVEREELIRHRASRIRQYFIIGAVVWVALNGAFLYWDTSREEDKQFQIALQEARIHLFEDHSLQLWIRAHSSREGTERQENKESAKHSSNEAFSGQTQSLSLFDDELLYTRFSGDIDKQEHDLIRIRHTVFKEGDSSVEWQQRAIASFRSNNREFYEFSEENLDPVLHVATPVLREETCLLQCHTVNNIPFGENIHAMGISVPLVNVIDATQAHFKRMIFALGTVGLLGLFVLVLTGRRIIGHFRETERLYHNIAEEKTEALYSKIRFESMFNSITDGVVFTDLDRRIVLVNKGFEDLFGYSLAEIVGEQTKMFYANPEQYAAKGKLYFHQEAETGQPVYEVRYRRKDGSVFVSETLATKVIGQDGEILGFLSIIRDITQRHNVAKELARSKKRLEVMLKLNELSEEPAEEMLQFGLDQCVALTESSTGYFHFVSEDEKNIEFFTWSGNVMESCKIPRGEQTVYPLEKAGIWADCIRTGEPVVHNDYQNEPDRKGYPEGHTPIARHMSVPLFDKKRIVGIIGVGNKEKPYTDFDVQQVRIISQSMLRLLVRQREVQEREKLQLKLQQASKMEAIGTLAGGIAHDFNNILGIIHGNADMAMEDIADDAPVQRNISRILQAAERAKEIIRQILLYSRQGETKLNVVNPCEMIDKTLELLRSTLPATVKIEQHPCKDKVYIRADRTMFQQLLMNLFVNAADAMHEKGTITVRGEVVHVEQVKVKYRRSYQPGLYFLLTVSDTGEGMDDATMSCIFDPFFTTKQASEGTGMGLSTVQGIVENHNGIIDVESEPGKGTTFYVYFPLTEEETAEEESKKILFEQGNERILFVDDEEMIAEMGSSLLQRMGYQVTPISSSLHALEVFRSAPNAFDLVITDQAMPDLSGYELSAKLLKIRPELPIILCTGFSKQVNREKALELGIREFVFKPLDREKLSMAIRKALAKAPAV